MSKGFAYGMSTPVLQDLCKYWLNDYDWRAQEDLLNEYPSISRPTSAAWKSTFVHVVGEAEGKRPLLLTHGWPGSFFEFWDAQSSRSPSRPAMVAKQLGCLRSRDPQPAWLRVLGEARLSLWANARPRPSGMSSCAMCSATSPTLPRAETGAALSHPGSVKNHGAHDKKGGCKRHPPQHDWTPADTANSGHGGRRRSG
jgi:hypothetical protein